MKISYYVPRGKSDKSFIEKEIASARNIKDSNTRNSVLLGLGKIRNNITDGKAFFWDGSELFIIDYPSTESKYFCGKDYDLSPLNLDVKSRYLLVVIDADNCTIGILNGKRIERIWDKASYVPRKQDSGGQSKQRFERARQEALKQWLKKAGEKVAMVYNERKMEHGTK